ncbi:MAG: hypothetical protein Q9196_005633 [Gyalolechia fulgens]
MIPFNTTFTLPLALLTYLVGLTSATPLSRPGHGFDFVPAPGPIPFSNTHRGGEWPQGVTIRSKQGLSTDAATQATIAQCLTDYGSGRFYDSWAGNICGNLGWFKGTSNDKIDIYDCYQSCAPYLLYDGARNGAVDYQCDYRKGVLE